MLRTRHKYSEKNHNGEAVYLHPVLAFFGRCWPHRVVAFTFAKTATSHTVPIPWVAYSAELTSIERALFTESKDALDLSIAGNLGQVYRLYQTAFDRTPDKIGFGFWLSVSNAGQTLTAIAQSFIDSAEFTDLYGANTSNMAFIDALYDNVLQRDGEASGGILEWYAGPWNQSRGRTY